jgi:FkbM family methyltransferase
MNLNEIERTLARTLPGNFFKDVYPRGMRRLAEMGLFRRQSIVSTKFGFKMVVDRLDAVKWYIYYFAQFEPQISLAWTRLLQPGDGVIDLGGNVGYHALLAGSIVGPTGRVVTLEPSKFIFRQLENNIKLNGYHQIKPLNCAISNISREIELYFAGENIQGNSSIFPIEGQTQSETVKALTIHDVAEYIELKSVRVLKIDVEGAENLALETVYERINDFDQDLVIFVEISPNNTSIEMEMLKPFLDKGFQCKMIRNEYTTKFYRRAPEVELSELIIKDGRIHDLVLTRNLKRFQDMLGWN